MQILYKAGFEHVMTTIKTTTIDDVTPTGIGLTFNQMSVNAGAIKFGKRAEETLIAAFF
jgi:hypothetical protein